MCVPASYSDKALVVMGICTMPRSVHLIQSDTLQMFSDHSECITIKCLVHYYLSHLAPGSTISCSGTSP